MVALLHYYPYTQVRTSLATVYEIYIYIYTSLHNNGNTQWGMSIVNPLGTISVERPQQSKREADRGPQWWLGCSEFIIIFDIALLSCVR